MADVIKRLVFLKMASRRRRGVAGLLLLGLVVAMLWRFARPRADRLPAGTGSAQEHGSTMPRDTA
jgi:hypothetical protein